VSLTDSAAVDWDVVGSLGPVGSTMWSLHSRADSVLGVESEILRGDELQGLSMHRSHYVGLLSGWEQLRGPDRRGRARSSGWGGCGGPSHRPALGDQLGWDKRFWSRQHGTVAPTQDMFRRGAPAEVGHHGREPNTMPAKRSRENEARFFGFSCAMRRNPCGGGSGSRCVQISAHDGRRDHVFRRSQT